MSGEIYPILTYPQKEYLAEHLRATQMAVWRMHSALNAISSLRSPEDEIARDILYDAATEAVNLANRSLCYAIPGFFGISVEEMEDDNFDKNEAAFTKLIQQKNKGENA